MNSTRPIWTGVLLCMLAACGGGGGGSTPPPSGGGGGGTPPPSGGSDFTPGIFQPSASFANECANPRSGTDPATGAPYLDQAGSIAAENNFLRSWTNELYLWYDEVPDLDPANYSTLDYFDLLKTDAITASGQPKDKFHFTYDSEEWFQLSQSGVMAGYGVQWITLAPEPPRQIVVAYTEPGSPAAIAGLQRGDEVLEIDGADAVTGNTQAIVATLNAALFPVRPMSASDSGETHTFRVLKLDGTQTDVTLTSEIVEISPVQNVRTIAGGAVGYLLFNDHIATAESALIDAVSTLDAANISDLVLDIRYNGGGYLAIASQLAYMIAGDALTSGQVFERIAFNDKHPTTNPVTGTPLGPTPFYTTTVGLSEPSGTPLPTLDLQRVYVLTSSATCSASEAIINGLRGVGVDVFQIGTTTCGKPYGFYPQDNCGTTYFSIQFKGDNAQGFGDYTDGFIPDSTASGTDGERVPGCVIGDDFEHELGSEAEARLAAALSFRASSNQTCPAASGSSPGAQLKSGRSTSDADGIMHKSPFRENRILRDM